MMPGAAVRVGRELAADMSPPSAVLSCVWGEVVSCVESLSNRLSARILPREEGDLMKVITICRDLLTPVVSVYYTPQTGFPHHENTPSEGLLAAPHARCLAGRALQREPYPPPEPGLELCIQIAHFSSLFQVCSSFLTSVWRYKSVAFP